ncbi:hypothetical protein CXB65_11710 [Pseudomonas monteilii]|uniref:Uncharacterized protein n=1 Tax=Pseudomonas monteilii TaxID=76759 RepID=A0A2N1IT02_9PSED|nr:hypothetical protein CXB65_11710 [Pseudomonas monteilii]RPD93660.1 hypothetical protein EGN69_11825 [Pseudomonas monteilii]TFW19932.1 hypothetical protein E4L40_22545 [Pseudomonas putida]
MQDTAAGERARNRWVLCKEVERKARSAGAGRCSHTLQVPGITLWGERPLPLPGSPQRVIPVPAAPWEYLLNDAPHWRRCH